MEPLVLNFISIVSLAVLLLFGAFLSAAEMAFSSLSRVRINNLAESGGKRGKRAQLVVDLYERRFDEVISAILICNNFVAITSATVSAALFLRIMHPDVAYILSTFVIASIVIVFTDILPKSNVKIQPERFALFCAPGIHALMTVLLPINKSIIKLKNRLNAKISTQDEDEEAPQERLEQELIFMVEEAETGGIINEDDSQLITNAIEFNDVTVWDVLTPRVKIASIPINSTVDEVAGFFLASGFSRMPVIENSIDEVRGIIHLRDFLKCMASGGSDNPVPLSDVIKPAVYTVTGAPITEALTLLKKEKSHMAIVADEYGGTEGLVTMEDILEELVGEIWDENDEVFEDFMLLSDTRHKIRGSAAIDKMFEYFDIEAESESNTVGGWIMDMLRRIPQEGDSFTFENLSVTVTRTNGRRAAECEVEVMPEPGEDDDAENENDENVAVRELADPDTDAEKLDA